MLKADRWVLYTGTPCQIAGLRAYLKVDYEKLITVDLVCHGSSK
ncbi:MAG: Coenzyme F420 hydrogenase/dehydrogenase, beta subunit C-terminal domain [Saccharofermentanales bacterium]